MNRQTCPSAGELRDLARGVLPEAVAADLERHLAGCDPCLERLRESADEGDTLDAVLPVADTSAGDQGHSGEVAALLDRIAKLRSDDDGETVTAAGAPADADPTSSEPGLAPPQAPDELGRLGHYRVLAVLGEGGMGKVYRAEDSHLGRLVALKVMTPALAADPAGRRRFLLEARAAAAIEHDHIVPIYQVGEDRGVPYLAMPLLQGVSLEDYLRRVGRLKPRQLLRIGGQIADGLAAAHARGLVHRDIKPGNVWIEPAHGGRVRILDFGLARSVERDERLTQSGMILGTPAYMAPEQAQGNADHRSDLFSLGCVLYRCATGSPPFEGDGVVGTLLAVATEEPTPPESLNPELPAPLAALIRRLLAKDPAARPASARAVAAELRSLARDLDRGEDTVHVEALADRPRPAPASKPAARTPTPTPPPLAARVTPAAPPPPVAARVTPAAPPAAPPPPGQPPRRRRLFPALGVACLLLALLGGAGYLGGLFTFDTPDGRLIVETDDDDVQVQVSQGGKVVKLLDLKTRKEITLEAGKYQLELVGGKDGLVLETREFTLQRHGRQVARIRFEPRPAGTTPPAADFLTAGLQGWHGLKGYWSYKDGVLTGSAPEGVGFNTCLYSQKKYRDFELKFRVRIKGPNVNSGVQIRSQVLDPDKCILAGPQCDMGDPYWGSLYGERTVGMMKAADAAAVNKILRPDDFNDYSILCHGKRVKIEINGRTTVDGEFDMPDEGVIGWQMHAGPGPVELTFRDVQFRELGAPPPGAKLLFDGQSLDRWSTTGNWKVTKNGTLSLEPRPGETGWQRYGSYLWSREKYGDFTLHAEYRHPSGVNNGIFVRTQDPKNPVATGVEAQILDSYGKAGKLVPHDCGGLLDAVAPRKIACKPAGEWNQMVVTCKGDRLTVELNGELVVDADLGQTPMRDRPKVGYIGLQDYGQPIEFRNLWLLPLDGPAAPPPAGPYADIRGVPGYQPPDLVDVKPVPPPAGAKVLFDGSSLDAWAARSGGDPGWELKDGGAVQVGSGDIATREKFAGKFRLHAEFRVPYLPAAKGQARGNSGIYLQGRYEVQILDSHGLKSGPGDCGAIYSVAAPAVNACKAPTVWQSYDIEFQSPVCNNGKVVEPAVATVYHNGVKVHDNVRIATQNTLRGLGGDPCEPGPIVLQDHGNPVQFRNIWLLPLDGGEKTP